MLIQIYIKLLRRIMSKNQLKNKKTQLNPQKKIDDRKQQPIKIEQPIKSKPQSSLSNLEQNINQLSTNASPQVKSAVDNYKIQQSRLQCILLQSQLRKINMKVTLQQQLIKNKRMLQKLEQQLKMKQDELKNKKRQKIRQRIQQIQKNKKARENFVKQSNQAVSKIKLIEQEKQSMIQKILQKNKQDYQKCYQKALQQRKRKLLPIDFDQINLHSQKYKKIRYKHQTQISQQDQLHQNYSKRQNYKKNGRSTPTPNYSNRYSEKNSQDGKLSLNHSAVVKMSVQQYLKSRRKQQLKILQLKELRQKRRQYGDKVQKEYHKMRSKTQSIEVLKQRQKIARQQRERQMNQRNQILKKLKKPNLPFEINLQNVKNQQLINIKKSNQTPTEKLKRLNQLSQQQSHRVNLKGKSIDLDRLNKINMARAQILLNL